MDVTTIIPHDPVELFCGDTLRLVFNCHNADRTPLDLTGNDVQVIWKLDDFDGNMLFTKTLGAGVNLLQPWTAGALFVMLLATETATITPGYYQDSLRVLNELGNWSTQAVGRIRFRAPI